MSDKYFNIINNAFFELKENITDHEKIAEYFELTNFKYIEINDILKTSTDNGYIEAREMLLNKILSILDEAKFKTITVEHIDNLIDYSTKLLFISVIVRRIFSSDFIVESHKIIKYDEIKDIDLKTIVSEISILKNKHKELVENRYLKEISLKLQKYNIELQKLQELSKNIIKDKKTLFLQNAKKDLDVILTSIKKNYQLVLQFIYDKEQKIKDEDNLLLKLDFKSVISTITEQLSIYSKLRASIIFIKKEKHKFQHIIEKLYTNLSDSTNLIHKEEKLLLSLLIKNKIDSSKIDNLIFSIRDMIIKIINDKYIIEEEENSSPTLP